MQYQGWLDTLLHARFPRHDLVIRNLGFSGDEVATRLRSKNFGTPDEWLSGVGEVIGGYKENRLKSTNTRADVIFAFFGYNESYGGDAGLPAFRKQLDEWITHTLAQNTPARPRRASSCSRRSLTKISAIRICPTARRTTRASRCTPWRCRRSRRPATCASSISSRRPGRSTPR